MNFLCVQRGHRAVLRTIGVSSLVTSTWIINLPACAQTTSASNGAAIGALKPLCVQPDTTSDGKIKWEVWGARLSLTGVVIGLAISAKERVPAEVIRDIMLSTGAAAALIGIEEANADKSNTEPPRDSLCDANAASKVLPQYRSSAGESSPPGWWSRLSTMLSAEEGPSTRRIIIDRNFAEELKRSSHPPTFSPDLQRALNSLDERYPKPTSSPSLLETTRLEPGLLKLSPEELKLPDAQHPKPTLPASDVSKTLTFELQLQYLKNRPEAQQAKSTPPAPNAQPSAASEVIKLPCLERDRLLQLCR